MFRSSEDTEVDCGKDEAAAERQREIQRRREEERRKRQAVCISSYISNRTCIVTVVFLYFINCWSHNMPWLAHSWYLLFIHLALLHIESSFNWHELSEWHNGLVWKYHRLVLCSRMQERFCCDVGSLCVSITQKYISCEYICNFIWWYLDTITWQWP